MAHTGKESEYIYKLIHFAAYLKLTQHCKSLYLNKNYFLKRQYKQKDEYTACNIVHALVHSACACVLALPNQGSFISHLEAFVHKFMQKL